MKNSSIKQKANYIVRLYKSINKNINEAIKMSNWYSMSDIEQIELEKEMKRIW